MRGYAIGIAILQVLLWLGARKVALVTRPHAINSIGTECRFPPLSEFAYQITPYAWIVPLLLMVSIFVGWKHNENLIRYAVGIGAIVFLLYLALCMAGFSMPFVPKTSDLK